MIDPKHDYAGDKFYEDIFAFAFQGLTDAEVAYSLDLTPEVFSRMKNGKYEGWNEEENEYRGERLSQVLARARMKVNSIVRGAYLKGALGGKKIKSTTNRYVQDRCGCEGKDKKCPDCGGTGWVQLTDKTITQETESELPPNIQALSTWLYHHDEDWRKLESTSKVDITTNGKDMVAPPNVNIQVVTNDPKLLELQEKSVTLKENKESGKAN